MKVFEGLQHRQAIKTSEDTLILHLESGNYIVDGVPVKAGYKGVQVSVSCTSEVQKVVQKPLEISHYVSTDGEEFTQEQIKTARELRGSYYNEDLDEIVYPDLETEFEVRNKTEKFLRSKVVYKDIEHEYLNVDMVVIGCIEDTGSSFIETPYVYGIVDFGSSGVYKVWESRIVADELKSFVEKYNYKVDYPNHSHLEYVKIEGEYVMTGLKDNQWVRNKDCYKVFNDLKLAKEHENHLRTMIGIHLCLMFNNKKLDPVCTSKIYKSLTSLRDQIRQLDVKQKSHHSKIALVNKTSELIKTLEEQNDKTNNLRWY